MLAIVDARAPRAAIVRLEQEFETVLFQSHGLTYPEVSGHPDIFMFQHGKTVIAASNTPSEVLDAVRRSDAELIVSLLSSGNQLADSTYFNSCATNTYWLHKARCAAPEVANFCMNKQFVSMPQAYMRCTTAAVSDNCIISSDAGVCAALSRSGIHSMYVDPSEISLPGFRYGFFGGTCGCTETKLFFLGNILEHTWGGELDTFLSLQGIEPVCLCNGKLYDGGGIFFI